MSNAALVVTTYNNSDSLGICLQSLTNQTDNNFDIFIADDGSNEQTKTKVEQYQKILPVAVHHQWHPDNGYQKSKINNDVFRGLKQYSIVICIDGDTFVHPRFIEDHQKSHQGNERTLFMGRRIELGPNITKNISEKNVTDFNQGLSSPLLKSWWSGETKNLNRALRITNPFLKKLMGCHRVPDLLGSNYSLSRSLLFEVNGYNEDYQSYWGEDGDLFVRIRNSGANILGFKSYAVQYHLYHSRREPTQDHQRKYEELLRDYKYVRCTNGIIKDCRT